MVPIFLFLFRQKKKKKKNGVVMTILPNPFMNNYDNLTHRLDPYMQHQTWSSIILIMARCLFGAKPLPEPLLSVNWIIWEQISMKFVSQYNNFHTRKLI